jgi:hypothetical protein
MLFYGSSCAPSPHPPSDPPSTGHLVTAQVFPHQRAGFHRVVNVRPGRSGDECRFIDSDWLAHTALLSFAVFRRELMVTNPSPSSLVAGCSRTRCTSTVTAASFRGTHGPLDADAPPTPDRRMPECDRARAHRGPRRFTD